MRRAVAVEGDALRLGPERIALSQVDRMAVVGAGKAGAGMAAALEEILGDKLLEAKRVAGWVNVPADCVRPTRSIHLHAARPAGRNEPTAEGVAGALRILELVAQLRPRDLCVCLLSGGASALLPAPVEGISLEDKLAVTRHLSAAGANIWQLNTVRKHLSRIKGGGLARACRAGRLVTLIISDVLGDPLDVIGSGPTVPDSSTPQQALAVLEQFHASQAGIAQRVFDTLRSSSRPDAEDRPCGQVRNIVIGNNAVAVDAACEEARRRGYAVSSHAATTAEGEANDVGADLARRVPLLRRSAPAAFLSGGEPVVTLAAADRRGVGGRNQQVVLAGLVELQRLNESCDGVLLLSGGTDGEDGPTDAAGAWVDAQVAQSASHRGLDAPDFLRRNDAYHFFQPLEALLKTGPTGTNVCDLRVVLVQRRGGNAASGSPADG